MKANRTLNYFLALAVLLLLTSGCKTLEERCLERFPTTVVTQVRTDTLVDTLILPDTWVEYVDTTLCPPGLQDTLVIIRTRTRTLPGDTIVREYYCTDTVSIIQDAEKLLYLTVRNAELAQELKGERGKIRTARWIMLSVAGLLALYLLQRIVRRT